MANSGLRFPFIVTNRLVPRLEGDTRPHSPPALEAIIGHQGTGCLSAQTRVPCRPSPGEELGSPWTVSSRAAHALPCPGFHGEEPEPNPVPLRVTLSPSFTAKFWTPKGLRRLRRLRGAAHVGLPSGLRLPHLSAGQAPSPPPPQKPVPCADRGVLGSTTCPVVGQLLAPS